jgi:GT2 family glycosyltransferase
VIIPCQNKEEVLFYQGKLARKDVEVIILPDSETGHISPGAKRNIGIRRAKGEICAFCDADVFPHPYWLNYNVLEGAGWCGPGLIPNDSTLMERASDLILRWMPHNYRVKSAKKSFFVSEFPTFNLIIRKSVLELVGGFSETTLTGEDSDLCKRITDLGLKIVYIPQCIVYHKRRPLIISFLKQILTYSIHRGFFFKKGLGDSRRLVYALPSICLLLLLFVILWFVLHTP